MNPGRPVEGPVPPEQSGSPIADLSYRHYDGPLHSRANRWWVITLAAIRPSFRKWWFWVLVLMATGPYLMMGFMLYLQTRFGVEDLNPFLQAAPGQRFAAIFHKAYESGLFWVAILALTVGAPSIAADNRTNALQIYLSKPITKLDYILGKLASVMVVVGAAVLIPSTLLYLYCLLSHWSEGFLRNEPWLFVKILGVATATALLFSCVFVGISAWCRSTMMAAAVSAGIWFATQIGAYALWVILYFRQLQSGNLGTGLIVQHSSLPGILQGLVWNIYGVTVRTPFGGAGPGARFVELQPPALWYCALVFGVLMIAGFVAALLRVRPVEVVA